MSLFKKKEKPAILIAIARKDVKKAHEGQQIKILHHIFATKLNSNLFLACYNEIASYGYISKDVDFVLIPITEGDTYEKLLKEWESKKDQKIIQ